MQYQVFEQKLFLRGLNNPVFLKLVSIIFEIFDPSFLTSIFSIFSASLSTCNGETAMGSGSKFPLVISTFINANKLLIEKKNKK